MAFKHEYAVSLPGAHLLNSQIQAQGPDTTLPPWRFEVDPTLANAGLCPLIQRVPWVEGVWVAHLRGVVMSSWDRRERRGV